MIVFFALSYFPFLQPVHTPNESKKSQFLSADLPWFLVFSSQILECTLGFDPHPISGLSKCLLIECFHFFILLFISSSFTYQ